jgi:carbon-monoxide dehydrogenase small subunit
MTRLEYTINGEAASVEVEPRTSLADMLRERMNLTGTHLGCEQGVCGACTVFVDGVPARSCITNALSCAGADIKTIEAFDDDPLMDQLRGAFNANHALQCGFCTPGMLITARDIALRLDDPTEERIRIELAGNLCRCTGYMGIVRAVQAVVATRSGPGLLDVSKLALGPAGAGHQATKVVQPAPRKSPGPAASAAAAFGSPTPGLRPRPKPSVHQSFVVAFPRARVWEQFGDIPSMIGCIPGASLISAGPEGTYQIKMRIKMGPITAEFVGIAEQQRDDSEMVGVIGGSGRDSRSASLADGELTYRLVSEAEASTRIEIDVGYVLSGALGQFARGGIVKHFIGAITRQFAENLRLLLEARPGAETPPQVTSQLDVLGSLMRAIAAWLAALLRKSRP